MMNSEEQKWIDEYNRKQALAQAMADVKRYGGWKLNNALHRGKKIEKFFCLRPPEAKVQEVSDPTPGAPMERFLGV